MYTPVFDPEKSIGARDSSRRHCPPLKVETWPIFEKRQILQKINFQVKKFKIKNEFLLAVC